ncbi:MAG: histidinol dehydrogenase [Candidatus Saccharicenans sp.]|uniref:histidinol dehydrogenase n=1 Tax=Candidatus Saccharicenans sp. TaxID=2819258 RepID=UPI00404AD5CA
MVKIISAREFKTNLKSESNPAVRKKVQQIISRVISKGDQAVQEYTRQLDRVELKNFRVQRNDLKKAKSKISPGLKEAIKLVAENLYRLSEKQLEVLKRLDNLKVEIRPGVLAIEKIIPIKRIGIYIPGGRYPLISSLLMAAVPARVAGVKEIAVCSPPGDGGRLHPAILYIASLMEIEEIYTIGGAQAITALAAGTETIKPVDKIVGPGNVYVSEAKKELYGRVGIDFIAGPTECLIIADRTANPDLVASDLIAQAEHDPLARAWLITDDLELARSVREKIVKQLEKIKTSSTARRSLTRRGLIIMVEDLEEAVDLADKIAPEHLELQVNAPVRFVDQIRNYGSLFIGNWSTEALGDYSSGLNHILPTDRAARYTGGLSVKDFIKFHTILKVSKEGLREIGPAAIFLARAEGLSGHEASVRKRLKLIQKDNL